MTVTLVQKYNPQWPWWFAKIRERLEVALEGTYVAIEHVGSTSVPGMTAKPVIDLDVVIVEERFAAVKEKLATLGYDHQGDLGVPGREAFDCIDKHVTSELPAHHLYVCARENHELRKHMAFRNFLWANPPYVEQLSALKWFLAAQHDNDRSAYMDGKSALVREITALALQDS